MGPIWDFNLSMGNGWDCFVQNRENFMYNYNEKCLGANTQIPFWWSRLLEDEYFANELRCTWEGYRNSFLQTDSVLNYLNQQADYIAEAKDRNFVRWPILEVKVHFNFFLGTDYDDELNYVRDWLEFRLNWLDDNMFGYCGDLASTPGELNSNVYPVPSNNTITFEYFLPQDSRVNIILYDVQGREVKRLIEDAIGRKGFEQFDFQIEDLPKGVYFLTLYAVDDKRVHKIVKM